jgi:hypothetical protein
MGLLEKYDGQAIEGARESTGGFLQFPVGENEAVITGVQDRVSQNGNDMLEITFGNGEGAEIRDYIVDNEWATGKLKNLQTSFKIPYGEQNTAMWIGKRGVVVVKEGEPYNGKIYNRVSHYRSGKTTHIGAPASPAVQGMARPAAAPSAPTAAAAPGQPAPAARNIPF